MCIAVLFIYTSSSILWTKVRDIPLYMDQHKLPNVNLLQLNPLLLADWFNMMLLNNVCYCISHFRAHSQQPPQWTSFITHEQNEFVCELFMQPFLRKLLHWIAFNNLGKNSFNSAEKYSNSEAATDWWTYEWKCVSIIFHHSNKCLTLTPTHACVEVGGSFYYLVFILF